MSRFPTPGHLVSWAGRAPLDHQSGQRKGRGRRKKGNLYIGAVTGETSVSAGRTRPAKGHAVGGWPAGSARTKPRSPSAPPIWGSTTRSCPAPARATTASAPTTMTNAPRPGARPGTTLPNSTPSATTSPSPPGQGRTTTAREPDRPQPPDPPALKPTTTDRPRPTDLGRAVPCPKAHSRLAQRHGSFPRATSPGGASRPVSTASPWPAVTRSKSTASSTGPPPTWTCSPLPTQTSTSVSRSITYSLPLDGRGSQPNRKSATPPSPASQPGPIPTSRKSNSASTGVRANPFNWPSARCSTPTTPWRTRSARCSAAPKCATTWTSTRSSPAAGTPATLLTLAASHDPGFDPLWFAEALTAIDRLPARLFEPYGLTSDEVASLKERMRHWAHAIKALRSDTEAS
jgi:hypothetical protein